MLECAASYANQSLGWSCSPAAQIFETLLKIRRRDQSIYQPDAKFYSSEEEEEEEEGEAGGAAGALRSLVLAAARQAGG